MFDLQKITIIVNLHAKNRKIMHQYIESNISSTFNKTSLHCSLFESKIRRKYLQKPCCNYGRYKLDDTNFVDQDGYYDYYYVTCKQCGNELLHYLSNPKYPKNKVYDFDNNIIVVGNYVKGYAQCNFAFKTTISEKLKLYNTVLGSSKIYQINNPLVQLTKTQLSEYIIEQLLTII
jgi:hypothetical protein